jgi:hypothetical protein
MHMELETQTIDFIGNCNSGILNSEPARSSAMRDVYDDRIDVNVVVLVACQVIVEESHGLWTRSIHPGGRVKGRGE